MLMAAMNSDVNDNCLVIYRAAPVLASSVSLDAIKSVSVTMDLMKGTALEIMNFQVSTASYRWISYDCMCKMVAIANSTVTT